MSPSPTAYPYRRVAWSYVLCTGVLAGVLYSLLLALWSEGWEAPTRMLMTLLSAKTLWFTLLMALNGALWFAACGPAAAAVALSARLRHHPLGLLLPALAAAVAALLPYWLFSVSKPPVMSLPGWMPFDFYGLKDLPDVLPAVAGGAAAWLVGWWVLPYAEGEEEV